MVDQYKLRRALAIMEMTDEKNEQFVEYEEPEYEGSYHSFRDAQGRFAPQQPLKEYKPRQLRIKKVRGTYGTYNVYDAESFIRAVGILVMLGVVAIAVAVL